MNIFRFFINRKTFVSMIFIGLSLLGYISYRQLPIELIPDVELPSLIVQISSQRDMNPLYIEKQALISLREAVGSFEGSSELECSTQHSIATIYLYLNNNVCINYA